MNNKTFAKTYASTTPPDPKMHALWMDLTSDPYGSVIKCWNGSIYEAITKDNTDIDLVHGIAIDNNLSKFDIVELQSITTEPANKISGHKYYNPNTKLIYICNRIPRSGIQFGWHLYGSPISKDTLYKLGNQYYIWDGVDMIYVQLNTKPKFLTYKAIFSQNTEIQTGGILIAGQTYIIYDLLESDDFENVDFRDIEIPFMATGTTPTEWSGGTIVVNLDNSIITARVLNRDENDYLGDVVWTRDNVGKYVGTLIGKLPYGFCFTNVNTEIYQDSESALINNNTFLKNINDSDTVRLYTYIQGILAFHNNDKVQIEIRVRQRGDAPILLSAETNTDGSQVILTFDKEMSDYDVANGDYLFSSVNLTQETAQSFIMSDCVVENNTIVIYVDTIANGDELTIDQNYALESLDYGLKAIQLEIPIVNNVLEIQE